MNPNAELPVADETRPQDATPSADFIQALSAFLETDPSDLLLEMGYYRRDGDDSAAASEQ